MYMDNTPERHFTCRMCSFSLKMESTRRSCRDSLLLCSLIPTSHRLSRNMRCFSLTQPLSALLNLEDRWERRSHPNKAILSGWVATMCPDLAGGAVVLRELTRRSG